MPRMSDHLDKLAELLPEINDYIRQLEDILKSPTDFPTSFIEEQIDLYKDFVKYKAKGRRLIRQTNKDESTGSTRQYNLSRRFIGHTMVHSVKLAEVLVCQCRLLLIDQEELF